MFGEVIQYFIIDEDESYFMASLNGDYKVIISRNKEKYEKNCVDSSASITTYRTGGVTGDQGPIVISMSGARTRSGYSDIFLQKYGLA